MQDSKREPGGPSSRVPFPKPPRLTPEEALTIATYTPGRSFAVPEDWGIAQGRLNAGVSHDSRRSTRGSDLRYQTPQDWEKRTPDQLR